MKIWILGAEGLLGRELVRLCCERAIPYVATGRQVDITDLKMLQNFADREKPTHAINCAAYTDVDRAEVERDRAFAINAEGPGHLGRIGKKLGMRVLHLSTDYVFDGKKGNAYREEEACAPLNVYGSSKRAGEERLFEEFPRACVVRTSWLFGEGGKNFLSKLLLLLQNNEQLKVDDEQINRLTSVKDLAEGLLKLLNFSGVWHYANNGEVTRYQVAAYVLKQAKLHGLELRCKQLIPFSVSLGAPRPLYSALATEKVEALLGPLRPWQECVF